MIILHKYLLAISFGLLSGVHCVGMCGGITTAITMHMQQTNTNDKIKFLLIYQLGRITSYGIAGLIFAIFGWSLSTIDHNVQLLLRTLAGLLLIFMGLYISNWYQGLAVIEKLGHKLWQKLQPLMLRGLKKHNKVNMFYSGLIWGWLPCGLVYSTLFWAGSFADVVISPLLMLCFGLGTIPSILAVGTLSCYLSNIFRAKVTRNISGLIVIVSGILTMPTVSNTIFMMADINGNFMK
jgi:hypothetical protein